MAFLGIAAGLFVALKVSERYSISEPSWETSLRVVVDPRSVFSDKSVLYVLVLGTDYNYTNRDIMYTKDVRSDTMLLTRLDLDNKKIRILSIPRDTRVNIPHDGWDRINSAFAIGGPKLSEEVVQNLLGIPIDYYVRIKEQGLKNLVDAIGGINIDVEKDMNYVDHWGHLNIHLKKGYQHLNGEKAAEYSRFRHDEMGDYGRIERQQKVIKAIEHRLTQPAAIARLGEIIRVAKENIESNLSFTQLASLGNLFKNSSLSSVETMTLPTLPKDILEGKYWVSYVEMQPEEAKRMIDKFTAAEVPKVMQSTPLLRVEVLNGSGADGKAQEVAELLRSKGYLVARVTNADNFDYHETEIIDHTGQGQGSVIAQIIQKGKTMSVPQDPRQIDITVIVGRDM